MRFGRLDILRYGALTDRALAFRPDAKLHIVYGANEAGKSSALKAISDLLFGFPHEVEHAFLHDAPALRLGASISSRSGNDLSFRRRRGRKNTLISHSDQETPLADDALVPFLGALGRPVFERAFGLDSARLRDGAKAMLQSGGEIGSLLFSAASGLTGLTNLRRTLESDAEGIFAQRRSKDRLFYQALERHEDARKAEREHELKSGDWKRLVEQAETASAALSALQAARLAKRRELGRLTAMRTLEPLIREIDVEEAAAAAFSDIDALAETEDRLAAASDAHRLSVEKQAAARADVLRLRDELSVVQVDEPLFAAAGKIIERYAGKSAYLAAKADIARVRGEVDDFDLRLAQLMRKLGLDVDAATLEAMQPTDAMLAQLQQLKETGRELRRDHAIVERDLAKERSYIRDLDNIHDGPQPVDPRQHTERLAALQAELNEVACIDGLQVRVDRARAELEEGIGRLSPAIGSLDKIVAAPLPDVPALSSHQRLVGAATSAARDLASQLANVVSEARSIADEMVRLEAGDVIVTREEIARERTLRDQLWRDFLSDPVEPARAGVEMATAQADRLADLALADAQRVARHTQLQMRSAELTRAQARLEAEDKDVAKTIATLDADYRRLFTASGVEPLGGEQMIEWRRAIDALASQRTTLNALADELAVLRLSEERILPVLTEIARETGLADGRSLSCATLGRALTRHLDAMDQRWSESRATEVKRISSQESIADFEADAAQLSARIERWQLEFADVTSALGLGESATIEMAEATLDVWRQVPQILAERANRDRRVRGMSRDISAFEEGVGALAEKLAADLSALSADAAIDALHQRAVSANAEQQRQSRLITDLGLAELSLSRYDQAADQHAEALSMLTSALPLVADTASLLVRMRERRTVHASLAASRRRFVEQADGQSEAAVRSSLADFDRTEAILAIEQLEREDVDLVTRLGDLTAEVAENQRRQTELATSKSVEFAVFERLSAEQETTDLARQWVVLKLAARMLSNSMEAYREAQSDPVIIRAGAVFSVLTEGAFVGLAQEYGDDDALHLAAVRASGERVPLAGLSEGTGDQLYLALRLAFIEDYCSRNEPAPLVIDDIFQTFDDDRTRSGLKALASTSEGFQTILFTHQASVVEIARRELGNDVDIVLM
jgi:chromosome segregation protein